MMWWWWILAGCRCEPGDACRFEGSHYTVFEPDAPNGRALVYLHGASTDGQTVHLRHREQVFLQAGYTMVYPTAPDGNWRVDEGQGARDDAAWVAALADHLRQEGVADELFVGGQSIGGSMTWYVGCFEGDAFAGYLPSGGGFWEPMPAACPTRPAGLRHLHGLDDKLVPLEGRTLGGDVAQGSIFEGFERWVQAMECGSPGPTVQTPTYSCDTWDGCDLQLCLYEGGHGTPDGWEAEAVDWLDAR
jgi:polyhydroxybutyrate depolymerase